MTVSYRARCGKHACRARRTIKGNYDPNDREACHKPGCTGLMREDKNRKNGCAKDSQGGQPTCWCAGTTEALGKMSMRNAPHTRGTTGCMHYDAVVLERSLAPVSKHSPRKNPYEPEGEPPF